MVCIKNSAITAFASSAILLHTNVVQCFTPSVPCGSSSQSTRCSTLTTSKSILSMSTTTTEPPSTSTTTPTTTSKTSSLNPNSNSNTDPPLNIQFTPTPNSITPDNPLRVLIAGGGVGGLALANSLSKMPHIAVTVIERTSSFKRFGGPIQLASNALQILKVMDEQVYGQIIDKFTFTGDKKNGIKDGIRNEWYAEFDLKSPAEVRGMPYTGVIDRPDLQEIYLKNLPEGVMRNGDGVTTYVVNEGGYGVAAITDGGEIIEGDVLIGADGIWSAVRSKMRKEPMRGEDSGVAYSGYTLFAGELEYDSFDNGEVGYKVYIGPNQYFVVTDVGKGRYQWYAFLARPPGSADVEERPAGTVKYLKDIFVGWSKDIHHILDATQEYEIEQRDLYDRPPSVNKPWTDGPVALIGDSVHAMMPNLGQGGCQAIEDAFVLSQNFQTITNRDDIPSTLANYRNRRLIRSAAVQGLSRFASDIIIRGFDTPAKITNDETNGGIKFENFNYAGIVTRMLQPILPLFFKIQFNFLYDGWRNEMGIDVPATLGFLFVGGLILLLGAGTVGELGFTLFGLESVLGGEAVEGLLGAGANIQDFL